MRGTSADRLLQAVLAAREEGPAADTSESEMTFANMLLAARRLDAEGEHCPDRVRRRVHALFERLPEGVWETIARLVFDSWQGLAPAARSLGTERLMVYESGVGSLDLQLSRDDEGDGALLAVAVQGGGDGVVADVEFDGRTSSSLTLDEHGTGSLSIPRGFSEAIVVVRDADGEFLRTPVIPLRSESS